MTVLGVGNVTNEGNLVITGATTRYLSKDELCAVAYEGDLLVVKSSGSASNIRSGKTAICPPALSGTIACSNFMYKLTVDRSKADPYLLWLLLNGEHAKSFIRTIVGASTYPNIKWEQYKTFEVSLPPLPDQRQIAARLKAQLAEVETARQAAQMQLRDATRLRQHLLLQAFGALADGPHKVLGEWASTTSGSTPSRGDKRYWSPAEIPWVKTGEVAFAPITRTEEAISKQALAECSLALLPSQTVLIAMYGQGKTRGQSAILEIEATTNQACFAILPNETWDADFLHHWLMASYDDLRSLSDGRGGNQANLNGGQLNALEIPAPDIDDQQRIVARLKQQLAEADALRNALEQQLRDLDALPQRILALAFEN